MQVGQQGVCLDFVKIGEEIRVQAYGIVGGELRRQGHTVRQIAGDGLGENADRNFINNDAARRGLQKPGRDFHKRCFAAAVGAKQANELARRDGKVHAVQRSGAAIALGQAAYLINCIHGLLLFLVPAVRSRAAGSRFRLRSGRGLASGAETPPQACRRADGARPAGQCHPL